MTGYTYPDGTPATCGYSPRGELTTIGYDGTTVDMRSFDDGGRMLSSSYNNGVSESGVGFQPATESRTHGPTHEILNAGSDSITRDGQGNITAKPSNLDPAFTSTLQWDFDNRLMSMDVNEDATADATFNYDALGRRVQKNSTVYALTGQQVIAEYSAGTAASSPTEQYVFASYIDKPVLKDGTGGLAYYHRNQQYSILRLTNSSGVVERYSYDAYGKLTMKDGSATTIATSNVGNTFTYTGRNFDVETGDYYYRARYYDPGLGRFCGRDPVGYEGSSWNLFDALECQPLKLVDPTGLYNPLTGEGFPNTIPSPRPPDSTAGPNTPPSDTATRANRCLTWLCHGPAAGVSGADHYGILTNDEYPAYDSWAHGSGQVAVYDANDIGGRTDWERPIVVPMVRAQTYGTTQFLGEFDASVCTCIKSQVARWSTFAPPYRAFSTNSYYVLKCLSKKCGFGSGWGVGSGAHSDDYDERDGNPIPYNPLTGQEFTPGRCERIRNYLDCPRGW